jgi:hypothetical protein
VKRIFETFRLLNQPCEQMAELISRACDERLSFAERFACKLHVLYCSACRTYQKQIHVLRELLRNERATTADAEDAPALSAAGKARIAAQLRQAEQR